MKTAVGSQHATLLSVDKDTHFERDSEAWSVFQNGSSVAFQHIYNQYCGMLYSYGRKLAPDSMLIEDCIQDLFADLWNSRKKNARVISVKAYLIVCFRRKLLLMIKKEKKSSQFFNLPELDPIHPGQEADNQFQSLTIILNKMPERQREVIYLKFFHGLTCEEIANVLHIKSQSVYNLIYRALKILKTTMPFYTDVSR